MASTFGNEIRGNLAGALGGVFGVSVGTQKIHLPTRSAHASFRPPQGVNPTPGIRLNVPDLYGAPLVLQVRLINGWLLFDFTPAFFGALVEQVNRTIPLPADHFESHAINRMLTLARHTGDGCPDIPAFHRALLLAVMAHESAAAYQRAEQAAETLFHAIPPKERPSLLINSGALGGALARLLSTSR